MTEGPKALTAEQIVEHADNLCNHLDHGEYWGFRRDALIEFARALATREQTASAGEGARAELVSGCSECRHASYATSGFYECDKARQRFDVEGKPRVAPSWCPLPCWPAAPVEQTASTGEPSSVKVPTNKAEAELMAKLGLMWLEQNAAPVEQAGSPEGPHADTADLVDRFAAALKAKLAAAEKKYGYGTGWMDTDWLDECRANLREHVEKGDPRDVAAYCAFLWHHGESTKMPEQAGSPESSSMDYGGGPFYGVEQAGSTPDETLEKAARACEALTSIDTDWDASYWNQAVSRCAFAVRALATPTKGEKS